MELIDQYLRKINYLRVSVTDRCDLRCVYCMKEKMQFLPRKDILTLEEIERLCDNFIDLGVEVYITELDVGLNLWGQGANRKKVSDIIKSEQDWEWFFEEQNEIYYNLVKTAKESGVKVISDWGFRDDIPYGGWRKDQKAWMVNKDYSRKGAYYSVLKALYDAEN